MSNILSQINHLIEERGKNVEKCGDYKVGMVGKPRTVADMA